MATYLLDTNIIIDAINQKRNRNEFLIDLIEQQGCLLACCPINVGQ
jgi:predicted nucleic acid-binding protein